MTASGDDQRLVGTANVETNHRRLGREEEEEDEDDADELKGANRLQAKSANFGHWPNIFRFYNSKESTTGQIFVAVDDWLSQNIWLVCSVYHDKGQSEIEQNDEFVALTFA